MQAVPWVLQEGWGEGVAGVGGVPVISIFDMMRFNFDISLKGRDSELTVISSGARIRRHILQVILFLVYSFTF